MARFRIVPAASRVWIEARSTLHPIRTETSGLEGWIDLDVGQGGAVDLATAPGAHVEFRVDRLTSGNPFEDRELRRRIDARRFPLIAGDLTSMEATGEVGRYRVTGDLTFMGVTRPYEDEMMVAAADGSVTLAGEKTFDVRDFGLEPPRILLLRVEPHVSVKVAITAEED
jgi:polyisoprenoid-binding protein YceI